MTSAVFTLSREAESAYARHQQAIAGADSATRKAAREAALAHIEDLFLAREFEQARIRENARIEREHQERIKAERIAARVDSWAAARVDSLQGQAEFFCDVLGGLVTACDSSGSLGSKAASARSSEAISDLINQRSEKHYAVALPPGYISVVADAGTVPALDDKWALPHSIRWALNGKVYSLYGAEVKQGFNCGSFAFSTAVRCGVDAEWFVGPNEIELDAAGRIPALPSGLQEAIRSTAPGAEALLEKFVLG